MLALKGLNNFFVNMTEIMLLSGYIPKIIILNFFRFLYKSWWLLHFICMDLLVFKLDIILFFFVLSVLQCTFPGCDRAFNQKYTMLIHMDIHTGRKDYKCEFCNKDFVQKSEYILHFPSFCFSHLWTEHLARWEVKIQVYPTKYGVSMRIHPFSHHETYEARRCLFRGTQWP